MENNIPQKFKNLLNTDNQEVRDYMKSVMSGLINENGSIDDCYYVGLQLLKDNYEEYIIHRDAIKKEGPIRKDSLGRTFKNQHYTMLYQSERNIGSLLKDFGFTRMAKARISNLNARGDKSGGFNTEDYLDSLTE